MINNDKLSRYIRKLYTGFGSSKKMGSSEISLKKPHYFLHRKFINDQDLLIIFNTKRCRYKCYFCNLPNKSLKNEVSEINIIHQFKYVIKKLKNSLNVIDRITLGNEGSILDSNTFSPDALLKIISAISEVKNVKTIALETRLEFVDIDYIEKIKKITNLEVNILTGFETLDENIRNKILNKRESIESFVEKLNIFSSLSLSLTVYILFKPSPYMNDDDAIKEANESIEFVKKECKKRNIPLIIRLNPFYFSKGTKWAELAKNYSNYYPPRLTDVLSVAQLQSENKVPVYVGLSTEGLAMKYGTYLSREDYSRNLINQVICHNNRQ